MLDNTVPPAPPDSYARAKARPRPSTREDANTGALDSTIELGRQSAQLWWQRSRGQPARRSPSPADASPPPLEHWLLTVPDIAPSCEMLLADTLFHDLRNDERRGLLAWIESQQADDGTWLGHDGRPDLDLTALGWWARRSQGADPDSPSMAAAARAVHAMGGAQRGSFILRLWLAMAGAIPWAFLPAVPSELLLIPGTVPLSTERLSPWARGILMAYYSLARGPARLHLVDPSPLLATTNDGKVIAPRLTKPGIAGDLLQIFDRTIKFSRKLPRGPLGRVAREKSDAWTDAAQQRHGGWFSTRPTLLSLLALRVGGATSDDERISRGLNYLRRARGHVEVDEGRVVAQGLGGHPLTIVTRLAVACQHDDDPRWLLDDELAQRGPWNLRTCVESGGWPIESGADLNVDLLATCAGLEYLDRFSRTEGPLASRIWASRRRAGEVVMAMQEADGGFARFERGESDVVLSHLPWQDARQLTHGTRDAEPRVALAARCLSAVRSLGWRAEDDRVARGLRYLHTRFELDSRTWSTPTVAAVSICAAAHCPSDHPLRRGSEKLLRSRQREDGSFESTVDTAVALFAILELQKPASSSARAKAGKGGATGSSAEVCVQSQRAAEHLTRRARLSSVLEPSTTPVPGLGLSPTQWDASAGTREPVLALEEFRRRVRSSDSSA